MARGRQIDRRLRPLGIGDLRDADVADVRRLVEREGYDALRGIDLLDRESLAGDTRDRQLHDGVGDIVLDAAGASRYGECEEQLEQVFHGYSFFLSQRWIVMPMLMAAILSLNFIFEAWRDPTLLPSASFCVTEVYWIPPRPNDSVAQTFGKM